MEKYSLQLIWSETENAYVASVPEIPRLSLVAATAAEAVSMLSTAISDYLQVKGSTQSTTPPPRLLEEYSGQFRLRLPRVLHAALVREAEAEGISLNSYLIYLLSHRFAPQQVLPQVDAAYDAKVRETIQCMHEMVGSVTVSAPAPQDFSLRNRSSIIVTKVQ